MTRKRYTYALFLDVGVWVEADNIDEAKKLARERFAEVIQSPDATISVDEVWENDEDDDKDENG